MRFDEMRESDPTGKNDETQKPEDGSLYQTPGHARSLCLVWPNGKRMFLNYSYLMSGELNIEGEMNEIILSFSPYTVILKGYGLEGLFTSLMDHYLREIAAADPRYELEDRAGSVMEIAVKKGEA